MANPTDWKPGETKIHQSMVARAVAGFRNMFAGANQNTPPPFNPPFNPTVGGPVGFRIQYPPMDWFGPGQPISPVAPDDTAGRQWDFPSYSNIDVLQKPREGIDFPALIALANSYDLVGMLIDTRKDQITKLKWSINPRDESKAQDARCTKITEFLAMPDKEHDWQGWLRLLMDDMLVIDAATVFPRQTKGGELYSLECIDGSTINRVIDNWGRTPLAPDPAYQQRLKGLPAVNYTRDQLIYKPRNITNRRLFGISPVERLALTIQTALQRELWQLQFYTDGSTPDMLFTVPSATAKQVAELADWFNGILSGNTAQRRKATFLPGDVKTINTKQDALKDPFDEWLARKACYCFGMSPQPFVAQMNRATAETADQQAKEEGIGPHMQWVKSLMDTILAHPKCFNAPDLEFQFEDADETDPLKKAQIDEIRVKLGLATIDEVRDDAGDDPLPDGLGAQPLIYTGQGAMLLADVINPPEVEPLALPPDGSEPPDDGNVPPVGKLAKDFHGNQFTGGIPTGVNVQAHHVVTPQTAARAHAAQMSTQAAAASAKAKTKATHHRAATAHHTAAHAHHAVGNHAAVAHHAKQAAIHAKKAKQAKKLEDAVMTKGMVVNSEYDIPYGFGISMDGGTIYRDKDLPEELDVDGVMIDLDETCSVHEITEFSHCKDGDPYLQGHQKGDEQEHALVARQGADPARYETVLAPELDKAYAKGKSGKARTPPNLATYPYVESGEEDLLNSAEKLAKKKTDRQGKLKAAIAKALKNTARSIATQYAHHFGKAEDNESIDDFINGLSLEELGTFVDLLKQYIADHAEESFSEALVSLGLDEESSLVFGLANTRAEQIASERAGELISSDGDGGELADATRLLIRGTIEEAFTEGWSSSELSDELESSYAFSEDRADLIAETEMRDAIGAGAIEGARASGVVSGKQWLLSNEENVCDDCQGNADDGVIGIDEVFSSGDDTIPQHPRCSCSVVFITDEGDEE